MRKRTIYYATRSPFKNQELDLISRERKFVDSRNTDRSIGDLIEFKVSQIPTEEPLEIDLHEMVRHKARSAYRSILAPCIVEHAGIVLEKNSDEGFPGGLTQPMWDALNPEGFLARTGCAGERAIAGHPQEPRLAGDFVIHSSCLYLEAGRWSSGRFSGSRSIWN
ncbi:hypothetical protein K7I14_03460, partial [Aurantimonas coralicida]|nr:hypothetical protein [Aurantimonas coralicida]